MKEKVIQPVQRVVEEKVNVQHGQSTKYEREPVIRDVQKTEETVTKVF